MPPPCRSTEGIRAVVSKENFQKSRDTNLEFWRGAHKLPADTFLRTILAEDIAAARHYGDLEYERELLEFQKSIGDA